MSTKLSDLIPPPAVVETPRGSFEVNGLGLEHISYLIDRYRTGFAQLLISGQDEKGESTGPDYSAIIKDLPAMANDIIAMGAGVFEDDEQKEAVKRLPAMVKVDALLQVWTITVPDPKKFQSLLWAVVGSLKNSQSKNASTGLEDIVDTLVSKSPS